MPNTQEHVLLKRLCQQAMEDCPVYFEHEGREYALLPREKLERLEDRLDVLEAREAMKEPGEITLEEIKRKYGLVNSNAV